MSQGLAISDIVNVSIVLPPTAAALRNFGNLLIVGSSDIIDTSERIRKYTSLTAVGVDFGQNADEYKAAKNFFAQSPTPQQVYIGRWAQAGTAAVLHGGKMAAAEQLASAWTGITTGAFKITIDGVLKSLSALNFSAVTDMNGVASVINTALGVAGTCTWNSAYSRLEFKSATTGATSTITYASAPGTGTDISAQIRGTQASGASAPVNGIVAETLLACYNTLATQSNDWYGAYTASQSAVTADHQAVAGFIESAAPSRIYGVTVQDANALSAASTTDLPYLLNAAAYKRTFTQYSSTDPHAAVSIYGRTFTVNFEGSNTAITVKFKTEPGITAETLTETQAAALKTKCCNVYVNYDNSTAIVQEGVMANGYFFDEVHGLDWLQNRVQSDVFNLLYGSPTKIPQTDAGINRIVTVVSNSCEQGVTNGLLAPGVWEGPNVGSLQTGQTLGKGYYVYAPPLSSQSASDRAARVSPPIQVAAKLAGAVHSANVIINVNR